MVTNGLPSEALAQDGGRRGTSYILRTSEVERPDFLDLALVYVLINFIATLAALKLFKYGRMGDDA